MPRRATRPLTALLAGLLPVALLAGCGEDTLRTEPVPPAAATVERVRPVVPQLGPFRRTGRDVFRAAVLPVTPERLGSSHRAGCPVGSGDLRLLRLTHLGLDGRARQGELVVHRDVASDVVEVFRRLYDAAFPVARLHTVDRYGGDDDASMAANNTSAYNCRRTTGGTSWSEHAYGRALDVNPVQNPYVSGGDVAPEAGQQYLDRGNVRPGMVTAGDVVVRAFAAIGWGWGGDFRSLKDYQHFSQSGR